MAGVTLDNVQLSELGPAERVVVDRGDDDDRRRPRRPGGGRAADRAAQQRARTTRLSTSTSATSCASASPGSRGRVAAIRVGAATETELAERMHRVQDAVQATRAALHEGILPGGGVALLHAHGAIDDGRPRPGRGDRRRDRAQRARGAAAPDRRATPASRPRSSWRARRALGAGARASTRRPASTCDMFEAGDHRPDDGHALGARARRVDRQDRAHDRVRRHAIRRRGTTASQRRSGSTTLRTRSCTGRRGS